VRKNKAFTLIELLVVVAIIALLISILLPSLSRARELSKRTVCMANEKGVGSAFYIYAQDDPGVFPAIAQTTTATSSNVQWFNSTDRTREPSTTGTPNVTVDMWAVVRSNNTTPKQFLCPSTSDMQDPAQDTTVYYDFDYKTLGLSYAYQYQHSPNRRILGTSSEPTFPVLSESNPYIKGGLSSGTAAADRAGQGKGNTGNHTNREGQNVLYQDSHVTFEKGPDTGLSGTADSTLQRVSRGRDNMYTTHLLNTQVDAGDKPTFSGALNTGSSTGKVNLGDKSDACVVP